MTASYKQKVTEARQLVKRSEEDQWRLAELTWRAVHEDGKTMREWAEDINLAKSHVGRMSQVWDRYHTVPLGDRPAFRDAYAEAKGLPVDPDERRDMEDQATVRKELAKASPERKKELIKDLASDLSYKDRQDLAWELEPPESHKREQLYERTAKERASTDPGFHPLDELINEAVHTANHWRHLNKIWSGRRRNWDQDSRGSYIREVSEVHELMLNLAQTEEGIDAELTSILEGGQS